MTGSRSKHIYKYDKDRQKIIIIDSKTGEEVKRTDDKLTSMLKYMDKQDHDDALRKFAIWCARQPHTEWKPIVYKMFRTAEDYLHGDISRDELETLYRQTEGMAVSTDSVGLQQGDLNAPLLLAARACINPDAYQAAQEAARYHKLWVEMNYKQGNEELSEEDAEDVNRNLLEKVTDKQMNYLLELIADEL